MLMLAKWMQNMDKAHNAEKEETHQARILLNLQQGVIMSSNYKHLVIWNLCIGGNNKSLHCAFCNFEGGQGCWYLMFQHSGIIVKVKSLDVCHLIIMLFFG
jgi:hypothetical protein